MTKVIKKKEQKPIVETSANTEEKQRKPQLFKPGQSGNPKGRPKGSRNFATIYQKALENVAAELSKKQGIKLTADDIDERLIESLIKQGINGNARHLELILAYKIGKPKHQEGDELQVNVDLTVDEEEARAIREAIAKAGLQAVTK